KRGRKRAEMGGHTEDLELDFPLWTLGTYIKVADRAEVFSIVRLREGKHGDCFPLFTDTDLAERFLNRVANENRASFQILEIKNPWALADLIRSFAEATCQFVAIDYFFAKTTASAAYVQVQDFLTECDRAMRSYIEFLS